MRFLFVALYVLLAHDINAQNANSLYFAAVDKIAMQIPDSCTKTTTQLGAYFKQQFPLQDNRIRAIFIWVAASNVYDIENVFAINFYEKEEDKINKILLTHKGICENYAALFKEICVKAGLKSYVVEGYTKQNGFADYIPHAWCAAMVNGSWCLFDPTWGSGYVNSGKFIRKINNDYFMAKPSNFIKSHIPFDYLWEFLNYPVTNQNFYEGKTQEDQTKPFFNFNDSIEHYEQLDTLSKLEASVRRVESNGVKNAMIFDRLQHLKMEIDNQKQMEMANKYGDAQADFNAAVNAFNEFIQYKNKQFQPLKPDADIQRMIDLADSKVKSAQQKIAHLSDSSPNNQMIIEQLKKAIADSDVLINEQENWVREYLSKSKKGRNEMFYVRINPLTGAPIK